MPGILATLPATIITAIASPMALPTPKTTATPIPRRAAETTTYKLSQPYWRLMQVSLIHTHEEQPQVHRWIP